MHFAAFHFTDGTSGVLRQNSGRLNIAILRLLSEVRSMFPDTRIAETVGTTLEITPAQSVASPGEDDAVVQTADRWEETG